MGLLGEALFLMPCPLAHVCGPNTQIALSKGKYNDKDKDTDKDKDNDTNMCFLTKIHQPKILETDCNNSIR